MNFNLEASDDRDGASLPISVSEMPHSPRPEAGGAEDGGCVGRDNALDDDARESESSYPVNESADSFFSVEAARALVKQRDDLLRQYEAVNRRVVGLAAFLPDHIREQVFGSSSVVGPIIGSTDLIPAPSSPPSAPLPPPSLPVSLQDVIVKMLDEALAVRSQDEIEAFVWSHPHFSNREVNTPAVIARALERASRNGRFRKRGLNYYSNNIPLSPDGFLPGSVGVNTTTVVGAIEKLLRDSDESLEPWEIIERLKGDPEVGDKIKQRPQGVYAALSRLAGRRIAYKDGVGGYRIGAK